MAVQPLLTKLGISNPKRQGVGFNYSPQILGSTEGSAQQQSPGQLLLEKLGDRKAKGQDIYQSRRSDQTNRVATDIASKSAFNIPTDEFGLVNQTLTDFRPSFTNRLQATREFGQKALQTEEAKTAFQTAKTLQNLNQYQFSGSPTIYGNGTDIPGASADNPGAKAVSLAMKAYQNKVPYVWGGNSLTQGIDCSGLIQQIYRQLGINVPRVTYDQAKSGKRVPLNQLRPGDLVFFNTGKADPNGIGRYGHVGLYIGNGQMIDARNSKRGILKGSMDIYGGPSLAIRPY